jgi:membrane-associated phospholipid phosphatase
MTKRTAPGLPARLWADLRGDLAAGAARTPAVSPAGARWLAGWAAASALGAAALLLCCGYRAGFAWVNALAAGAAPWVWQWLTMLGDERVAFALALFFSRTHPRVFWTLIVAAVVAAAYTHGLKPLVSALRPPAVLEPGSFNLIGPGHRRGSFPSGHTVTAAVFFGVWVYYVRGAGWRLLLIALAVAAGLSRVALGVHWPVDVAAGMFGGALAAWAGAALSRRSRWGFLDPSVHLALVVVALFPAAALLRWDGGYPQAAALQVALGIAALASVVLRYLARPLWGRLRGGTPV